MIEIAISLAIIGFALVAVIGILPTGMNVQKENRQETIIDQDVSVLMDGIRSGARGMDELTNAVTKITIDSYDYQGSAAAAQINVHHYVYTRSNSTTDGAAMSPQFLLTNGYRIIGLLSTPKYINLTLPNQTAIMFRSNYVVAYVSAMSGPASEKFPQTNRDVLDLGFTYRVTADVVPYAAFNRDWTNFMAYPPYNPTNSDWAWRYNYYRVAKTMQTNAYDLRLLFRWPLLANGDAGNGRQTFRTMVSGNLGFTNEPGFLDPNGRPVQLSEGVFDPYRLWFFEPRTYLQGVGTP
jgi:hypothetical protein